MIDLAALHLALACPNSRNVHVEISQITSNITTMHAAARYVINHDYLNDSTSSTVDNNIGDIDLHSSARCFKVFFRILPNGYNGPFHFDASILIDGNSNFGSPTLEPSYPSPTFSVMYKSPPPPVVNDPFALHVFDTHNNNYVIDPHVHNSGPPPSLWRVLAKFFEDLAKIIVLWFSRFFA